MVFVMKIQKNKYVSKKPDPQGYVDYTAEENETWSILYKRQVEIVKNRACEEYLAGLDILKLSQDRIPQLPEINAALKKASGWSVYPVAALINFEHFFELLANRQFPAATFIRAREELDYLQEPDIFHEIFGHCPMLTHPMYADFMATYGQIGTKAEHSVRVMMARLYWFTVEFGLIKTPHGLRIYGGGILSSPSETVYALDSEIPQRKPFEPVDVLRTPYRIDTIQPIYFIIENYQTLYDLVCSKKLLNLIAEAEKLGMHIPIFEPREHIKFC